MKHPRGDHLSAKYPDSDEVKMFELLKIFMMSSIHVTAIPSSCNFNAKDQDELVEGKIKRRTRPEDCEIASSNTSVDSRIS